MSSSNISVISQFRAFGSLCWTGLKKHPRILLTWGLLAVTTVWSGTAFYLILLSLLAPFGFVVWCICMVFLNRRRPVPKRNLATQAIIVMLAIGSLVGICSLQAEGARRHADAVLAKILDYKSRQGIYPKELGELGLSALEEKSRFHLFYFNTGTGEPSLFYQSTIDPFDRYGYDFDHAAWEFYPD